MGLRKVAIEKKDERGASIKFDDKTVECPIIRGSEGEVGLDISQLRAQTGAITVDNAFMNTAPCTSEITFLDGEKGILHYRGYPIEELAEHSNFLEVAHLLIHGELPTPKELETFSSTIHHYSESDRLIKDLVKRYPRNAHPMGVLSSLIVSLSAVNQEFLVDSLSKEQKFQITCQLMAQVKNIAAFFYRVSQGKEIKDSNKSLDYGSDFLQMMYDQKMGPEIKEVLDVLLILHADHEQNCSTSTVRLVGSSQSNLYASIASGVNALWGSLHGGANQAVIEMLQEIQKSGGDYKKFLTRAKDKNDTFRLMGFGHRVYKNFDPRAKIIKKACSTVLDLFHIKDPLLDIAKGLEEEALRDSYFVERKLYPNVDFYSGIIYKALGIPTNMFTVMFALGRLPGWIAQWDEMMSSPQMKIGRPRQIYTGHTKRSYPRK